MGDKRRPKLPTVTPTVRFPVEVDLGWASRDNIEGMISEPAYIMYGERLPCGSFLHRLIKYCTTVVPSIVTATTSVHALCVIALLAVKQEQRNMVDLFEN